MLNEVLRYLKNWFVVEQHTGDYFIVDGTITLPFLREGQYFRVLGSIFNDGVHQYPDAEMTDESFNGSIWALAIPKDLLSVVQEMQEWQDKYGKAAVGPYQSESFGGYSYTKKPGDGAGDVFSAFAHRLSMWRKV